MRVWLSVTHLGYKQSANRRLKQVQLVKKCKSEMPLEFLEMINTAGDNN